MTEKRLAIVLPLLAVVLVALNLFCTPLGALRLAQFKSGGAGAASQPVEYVTPAEDGERMIYISGEAESIRRWAVSREGIFFRARPE